MDTKVKSKRNKIVQNLRLLHGTQLYLTDQHVRGIFKQQKERMSTMLDALDIEMSNHPRQILDATTGDVLTTYTPWVKQDRKKKWDTFMDAKWEAAVKKHSTAFKHFYVAAHRQWCATTPPAMDTNLVEYCQRLRKVNDKHKSAASLHPFRKPWWIVSSGIDP